ncbi:hypothetical protein G8S21_08825 [Clostridium botulinum C]|uniref:hypothetical protein n=1 Tax=Clostridium botulinum TaxID=1491 RepID=UPI001E4C6C1C|nr:hypothetical protein [Clostridium botulinum]MCD3246039.1 hypothetical protein [Clostridium botulinum C]MCD3262537.1 hypothetical protein [Clostridium botulinum C]
MNECITTTPNLDSNVYIQIGNYGGFLAEFYVDYIEANGINHSLDSGIISLGFSRRLYIAKGTPRVRLKVEIWILGIIKILYDGYIETKTSSCFGLYYSIFSPSIQRIPCDSLGIPSNNSNYCCCCCPCQNYRCCNSCYRC